MESSRSTYWTLPILARRHTRETYRTLVREWGVRYIKLDFMDDSAVEGFYIGPTLPLLEA